jgi:hypothetical protein
MYQKPRVRTCSDETLLVAVAAARKNPERPGSNFDLLRASFELGSVSHPPFRRLLSRLWLKTGQLMADGFASAPTPGIWAIVGAECVRFGLFWRLGDQGGGRTRAACSVR